jgi:hypothetical protein
MSTEAMASALIRHDWFGGANALPHRTPSAGAGLAGLAGAGCAGLPAGLDGAAGRGVDGAAPVVVGVAGRLLASSVRLYPIARPSTTTTATSAASQVHIDPALLGDSRSTRR